MIKYGYSIMLWYCCFCFCMEEQQHKIDFIYSCTITPYKPSINTNPIEIIDALLLNPQLVTNHCKTLRQAIDDDINIILANHFSESKKITIHSINTLNTNLSHKTLDIFSKCIEKIKKYRLKHPLIFVAECDEKDCFFNRQLYPARRNFFEKTVVRALLSKIQHNKLVCTSFGSGQQFQDLVIMAKILAQNPSLHITLHAIDSSYVPYNPYQIGAPIKSKDVFDYNSHIYTEHSDFLTKTFPSAAIALFMYPSVESYYNALESSVSMLKPADYIYAIDIEDTQYNRAFDCFRWVCAKTLRHNPKSGNMLCATYKNQLTLYTESLENIPGSKEYIVEFPTFENTIYETVYYSKSNELK